MSGFLTTGMLIGLLNGCEKKEAPKESLITHMEEENGSPLLETTPPPIHEDILTIGTEIKRGQAAYDSIRHRLFSLPPELSPCDSQALLDMLLTPPAESWNLLGWAAIYNDGLNVLRGMRTPPPRFPKQLLDAYADSSRSNTIRNYSLQHFGSMLVSYYSDPAGKGRVIFPTSEERTEVETALNETLRSGNGAMMGTACNLADDIIDACKASGAVSPISIQKIGKLCAQIASSEEEELSARISSYGFLSKYKLNDLLDVSRNYLVDRKKPPLLRSAAIHYVAQFIDPQDKKTLEQLAKDDDLRISSPAKNGLKNYNP